MISIIRNLRACWLFMFVILGLPVTSGFANENCIVSGVEISISPRKAAFEYDEPVDLIVNIHNISKEKRFLGVSVPRNHEGVQKTTQVEVNGQKFEVIGIPCYMNIHADMGGDLRICDGGYSDQYLGEPLALEPESKTSFHIAIPSFVDNRDTGKFFVFSRFAVSKTAKGPKTISNGPESSLLIVDRRKLAAAAATLNDALLGIPKKRHEVENSIRIIADNPLPEHLGLILKVIQHEWPFEESFDWNIWYAASKFVGQEIYDAAVAQAKSLNIDKGYASLVYKTIYRNREHLQRKDILAILDNPCLEDPEFTISDNGFLPTVLLSIVAVEKDIPRLAEMCAKFMPVSISHDITHSRYNSRLSLIRNAFLQYPKSSRRELRKAFRLGLVPGEFPPWNHQFSNGNVPRPLVIFGEWLADLKDVESVPLLEHYAKTPLVPVSNTMQQRATSLLAQIDGIEAIKALRRLGLRGLRERAKLGDPAAIDSILIRARWMRGSPYDDTGESYRLSSLVYSIIKPTEKAIGDDLAVEVLWKKRRQAFVDAFIEKYGFHPDGDDNTRPQQSPAGDGLKPAPEE